MGHENMTAGQRLADLVNGRIIPAVEELRARWERLYPSVRNARRPRMMVCERCGRRVAAGRIGDDEFQRRTVSGRHLGHPDMDSPDEYITLCDECGATESFREIIDADADSTDQG
jgi:hypothetical protein